jgi:hypothetical protein
MTDFSPATLRLTKPDDYFGRSYFVLIPPGSYAQIQGIEHSQSKRFLQGTTSKVN